MTTLSTEQKPSASRAIRPLERPVNAEIAIPGSKSITNRALLMAGLANGTSVLENALFSEDSHWCSQCLQQLGIAVEADEAAARFTVHGQGGIIPAKEAALFVGNSGTTARFMVAAAALGQGDYRFDGVPRMRERPISNLLRALQPLGVTFTSDNERFPLTVHGRGLQGGTTPIDATESSQLLSALLHVAPYAASDVTIEVSGTLVSLPYIEITLKMMQQFGVTADKAGIVSEQDPDAEKAIYRKYFVRAGQRYHAQTYVIEPDASNATYFFAAAAVSGGRVRIPHLSAQSLQGDATFIDILERMGCTVIRANDYLEVQGVPDQGRGRLKGIDGALDMNAISDTVQTLAAIAPFADAPIEIRNVEHIRHKETDRVRAVVTELQKLGVQVEEYADGLKVYPSAIQAGAVDTYDDHRMAMAFSVIGLITPGIVINDPGCTRKTFPDFFERFEKLY